MAILLLAFTSHDVRADCPAAPIADPDDMVVSFLALNGTQAAPGTLMPSTVKEGMLIYDATADKLKICDGTNWVDVGSGSGTDTLASLSCAAGQIAKFNGTAWACAADGGGSGVSAPVAFSVSKTAAQTVTASTLTKLTWQAEEFDTNNNFTSDRFTPTEAGQYIITAGAGCAGATNCQVHIYKNGASYKSGLDVTSGGSVRQATVAAVVDMNGTTDYVEAYGFTDTTSIGNSASTYFTGALVGGGSADTLADLSCATNEIPKWNGTAWACSADGGGNGSSTALGFSVHRNLVDQTGMAATVWAPIDWTTEAFDLNDRFDLTNERYTPDVAGRYQFNLTGYCDSTSRCDVAIVKNSTDCTSTTGFITQGLNTGTGAKVAHTSAVVDMNGTSDYVRACVLNAGGTTVYGHPWATNFSGSLLGGSGSDTLSGLSCSTNEIPKWNGTAWACAADGGGSGSSGALQSATQATDPLTLADGVTTDVVNLTASTTGTYTILANGYTNAAVPWAYLSSNCNLLVNGTVVHAQPFYYGAHDAAAGSSPFFPHTLNAVSAITAGQVVKVRCMSTSSSATRTANKWRIDLVPVGGGSGGGAVSGFMAASTQSLTSTLTTIASYTEARDDGNGLNAGTGIFTAPSAGYYAFSATVFHANGSGDGDLYVASPSAGTICREYASPITSNNVYRSCSGVAYLAAGNTVYVQAKNGGGTTTGSIIFNGSALGGSGSGSSTLAGLTDVAVGTPSNGQSLVYNGSTSKWEATTVNNGAEISASSYRNTAQSITSTGWQVLNMEAEEWDTANLINIGTNPSRITIPAGQAGRYLVTAYTSADMNASGGRWLSVYKNGALLRYCSMPGNAGLGGNQTFTCSWNLDLSAGDYVELAAYQNSGSTLSFIPRLSLAKLSGGAAGGGSSQWTDVAGGINYAGGKVGIGTTTPEAKLVTVDEGVTGTPRGIVASQYNDGIQGPLFIGKKARGTLASPTAVQASDYTLAVQTAGYNGTAFTPPQTVMATLASENWTGSANGYYTIFATTPNATTAPVERLRIGSDGSISIGSAANAAATALLDLTSTTKGFLPPRMTTVQRDAIASPAEGLVVYNTTTKSLDLRLASSWLSFGGGSGGNTMVSGWPDAIKCNVTNPNWGPTIFYAELMPLSNGLYYYRNHTNATNYDIMFNGSGAFSAYTTLTATSDCGAGTTIAGLYSAGKAYNFVGGASASADGTAGQVQFNEGGNLKADAGLHWDNTNKRLGIGTASPGHLLDVRKDQAGATTIARVLNQNATGGASLLVQTSTSNAYTQLVQQDGSFPYGQLVFGSGNTGGAQVGTWGNAPLMFVANGSEKARIDATGNVGIGTATPGNRLAVQTGANASTDGIKIQAPDLTYITLLPDLAAGNVNGLTQAGDSGIFFSNNAIDTGAMVIGPWGTGSKGMRITSDGNIGIGTATPTQRLDVAAAIRSRDYVETRYVLALNKYWDTASSLWKRRTASFGTGDVVVGSGDTVMFNVGTSGAIDSNASEKTVMTLASTGNVGIGTTAPSALLHLSTAAPRIILTDTDTGANNWIDADSGAGILSFSADRNNTVANSAMGFSVDGSEAMRIITGGNVGIGTTAPGYPLQVNGGTNVELASGGMIVTGLTGGTNVAIDGNEIQARNNGAANTLHLQAKGGNTDLGNGKLLVDGTTGNVGIGTPSPAAKLDVAGTAQVKTAGNGFVQVTPGSVANNGYVGFFGSGGTRSGYVGWGAQGNVTLTADTGTVILQAGASGYQMTLDNAGTFTVPGAAYKPGGGVWTATSDARLKDIHGAYEQGLASVVRLDPVRFHYKKDNARNEPSDKPFVGLVAQDVRKTFPEAVSEGKDGYLSLDTTPINFAIINAIKELKAANDNQAAEIDELRREIKALKAAN